MSEKSATPILVAGAVGTVALLGVAWMFAANASQQAKINAVEYAASKASEVTAEPAKALEVAVKSEEPAEVEAEQTAEAVVVDAEAAKAEAEEPTMEVAAAEREVTVKIDEVDLDEIKDIVVVEADEPAVAAPAAAIAAATLAAVQTASIEGDAKAGKKVFRKCKACHKIGEGAANAVGPYLTGIVGRVQGSAEGFSYSEAFQAAMVEGKVWSPEELDAFLTKPKDYMPGNKMSFGGLRKEQQRADVITYLANESE